MHCVALTIMLLYVLLEVLDLTDLCLVNGAVEHSKSKAIGRSCQSKMILCWLLGKRQAAKQINIQTNTHTHTQAHTHTLKKKNAHRCYPLTMRLCYSVLLNQITYTHSAECLHIHRAGLAVGRHTSLLIATTKTTNNHMASKWVFYLTELDLQFRARIQKCSCTQGGYGERLP